jgi:hypothetical protein
MIMDTLHIVYTGNHTNGLILPGFNHSEIYPGEPVTVRGDGGFTYSAALRLVNRGDFKWCDENGNDVEEPTPTDAERALATREGAYRPREATKVYPEYHKTDDNYVSPDYVETPLEDIGDPNPTPEPPKSLEVTRRATGRRAANSEDSGEPVES